jgi:hypothetical protein
MIANRRIERYLGENNPEFLEEFKAIISAASLDGPSAEIISH